MGWLRERRVRKLADEALELVRAGREDEARQRIAEHREDSLAAWRILALRLQQGEQEDKALWALEHALALEPADRLSLLLSGEIAVDADRNEDAAAIYRRLLATHPDDDAAVLGLATALVELSRPEEALTAIEPLLGRRDVRVQFTRARALAVAGRKDEALEIATALLDAEERHLKGNLQHLVRGNREDISARAFDIATFRDALLEELHGEKAVVLDKVQAGKLDPDDPWAHAVLRQGADAPGATWVPDLTLRSVDESMEHGRRLIEQGDRVRGLCHLGAAALRAGDLDAAHDHFAAASEEDLGNFAARCGRLAVRRCVAESVIERVDRLPEPVEIPHLAEIMPDLPRLTERERKVACASILPLRGALPELVRRGAVVRILPIDARLADLPELAEGAEIDDALCNCVESDARIWAPGLAACRIERVLDLACAEGGTLAHEFAHRAHDVLPPDLRLRILALHRRALGSDCFGTYEQIRNEREFFAISYLDWLHHGMGVHVGKEMDEDGIAAATFRLLDELSGIDDFGPPSAVVPREGLWKARETLADGSQREVDLRLAFEGDRVAGDGSDDGAEFSVRGHWCPGGIDLGRVRPDGTWVHYRGVVLPGGIEGSWNDSEGESGELHLRPVTAR